MAGGHSLTGREVVGSRVDERFLCAQAARQRQCYELGTRARRSGSSSRWTTRSTVVGATVVVDREHTAGLAAKVPETKWTRPM